ncbi:hypothetical protein ORV05_05870 [Amycolatopsis cynarae]|uniref:MarR family transcriptional regulator n=1 Tax=Amycolatopsis cynarae TaxID=2995223 RepID=A0ABY7B7S8_9PSEU|nr:hypothetical protein [Amycolatopsis sp. HUAS 11-8]WAL67312.1 hypothetical protein ORV05_05870 [Amycolatopsis sp. HUAS 11-8]
MLSQSRPDIRPHDEDRGVPTRRIVDLSGALADELERLETEELGPRELAGLMRGTIRTASALTRILDRLRACPELAQPDTGPGRHRHHAVRRELDQAAAAAEDLQVTAEALFRLLPGEMVVPNGRRPGPRP